MRKYSLHIAAAKGQIEKCSKLISQGWDINEQNERGATALHYAAQCGHEGVCELLIEAEAGLDVNATSNRGWTPLDIAAKQGHLSICERLMMQPNIDFFCRSRDPFDVALKNNNYLVCKLLLQLAWYMQQGAYGEPRYVLQALFFFYHPQLVTGGFAHDMKIGSEDQMSLHRTADDKRPAVTRLILGDHEDEYGENCYPDLMANIFPFFSERVFANFKWLVKLQINDSVKWIANNAFKGCDRLNVVVLSQKSKYRSPEVLRRIGIDPDHVLLMNPDEYQQSMDEFVDFFGISKDDVTPRVLDLLHSQSLDKDHRGSYCIHKISLDDLGLQKDATLARLPYPLLSKYLRLNPSVGSVGEALLSHGQFSLKDASMLLRSAKVFAPVNLDASS